AQGSGTRCPRERSPFSMIFHHAPSQVAPEERLCETIAGIARASLRAEQALLPALEDEASLLRLEGESSFEKATASLVK
ncbi:hypothetical protein Pmar_PMAR005261, partial [Perkinsus marinus ATCC 50983]